MHGAVFVFSIFAAWRWGDWRNWKKYHTTMLYIVVGNLLYNFIYHDHLLWRMNPPLLLNSYITIELIYTFIILPCSTLILLTNLPKSLKGQLFRIAKFILIYVTLEWIAHILGLIVFKNGWNIWWSLLWDCMMFPMLILHHKKPLAAYMISIIVFILMLTIFPVPIMTSIESLRLSP